MNKKAKTHIFHYLPLFGILLLSGIGFSLFIYEKTVLFAISMALSLSYVLWGIVHHKIHKEFNSEIVFEYIAISTIGLIILLTIVYWI